MFNIEIIKYETNLNQPGIEKGYATYKINKKKTDEIDYTDNELSREIDYLSEFIDKMQLAIIELTTPFGTRKLDFNYDFATVYDDLINFEEFLEQKEITDFVFYLMEINVRIEMEKEEDIIRMIIIEKGDKKVTTIPRVELWIIIRRLVADFNSLVNIISPETYNSDLFQNEWMKDWK